ncbi:hypothetical protein IR083_07730 [Dysgonomonas sp. GY75]|uniref:hypothetical protein n=1 Tax=Dysgonomonas sp. GY75 TaxID=2780419 RepID=UPI0018831B4A|nr:hypothetical protein [Dysgonomonas sp. GY75]MBF0648707.1 hypothetical protein [Dysgonomonas sp. GY75]
MTDRKAIQDESRNRNRKLHYYKHIVKRHLLEIKEMIDQSKSDMEKSCYQNRYSVQLRDFARTLNVREELLDKVISGKKNSNE